MLPAVDMFAVLSVNTQAKCHAEFIVVFLRPTNTYLLTPNDSSVITFKPRTKYRIRMAIMFLFQNKSQQQVSFCRKPAWKA